MEGLVNAAHEAVLTVARRKNAPLNEGWGSNPSDTANRIRGGTLREDCPVLRLREP